MDAIFVCHKYLDLLEITLPNNRPFFNRVIVATQSDDHDIKAFCKKYDTETVDADLCPAPGIFRCGNGVNAAFDKVTENSWILKTDSDIILPPFFSQKIQEMNLDKKYLYGCNRKIIETYEDYLKWKENGCSFELYNFKRKDSGTGYFQLFHNSSEDAFKPIYFDNKDASKSDSCFSERFSSKKRQLHLNNIVVIHLGQTKVNWKGRVSRAFKPNQSLFV